MIDLTIKYYDSKCKERNIVEMIQLEPKWAAEMIQKLQKELDPKCDLPWEDFDNAIDTMPFAIYLTGHDEETIKQMYSDWKVKN